MVTLAFLIGTIYRYTWLYHVHWLYSYFNITAISFLVIVFNFSWNYFHIATNQLKKCKSPISIDVKAIYTNKNEFNHNFSMSYKCEEKKEDKQSICINGRWVPEPNCTSKLLFALSSSDYSSLFLTCDSCSFEFLKISNCSSEFPL